MNAHQIDVNGIIINTIIVDSIDFEPNLVDASIGGSIGDSVVNGVIIPKPAPPVKVPEFVDMSSAQLYLLRAGLLGAVESYVAALTGQDGQEAAILWNKATIVRRDSPIVNGFALASGMTDSQIDNMFIEAAKI